MTTIHPTIFKRDSSSNIRVWWMEVDGNKYRTLSGVKDGKIITTAWTEVNGKNAGKANETTPEEQATAEVEAQYRKKLSVDYHLLEADVDVFKTFKPMLATAWEKRQPKIKWDRDVMIQPKLDGIRCLATAQGLFSRTGKEIVATPHISTELIEFFIAYPNLVLDGELYNHELKADFNKLVSLIRKTKPTSEDLAESEQKVEYHIYDIAQGWDQPFRQRNEEIGLLFHVRDYPMKMLKIVETDFARNEAECDAMHAQYIGDGYEGSIIRLNEYYGINKRSNGLIKRKDFDDEEGIIVGYELGNGNYSGLPKVIQVKMSDGIIANATMTGSREFLAEFLAEFSDYEGKQATIQYFGRTPDGCLRFPTVKAVHKNPRL